MSGSYNLVKKQKGKYGVKDTLKATIYYFIQPLNDSQIS